MTSWGTSRPDHLGVLLNGRCPLCETDFKDKSRDCDHEGAWYREWLDKLVTHINEIEGRAVLLLESDALDVIWKRAEVEQRAGAPAGMVALYVRVEVEHIKAGHGGNAQDCMACLMKIPQTSEWDLS